jgi:leader peptidase (prepilin peptidase) / N-methyltransferase
MTQHPRVVLPIAAATLVCAASTALFPPMQAAVSLLLGLAMLLIAVADWRHFIIPDGLSLPAIPLGLLASGYLVRPEATDFVDLDHLAGAALGWLGLWAIAKGYAASRGAEGLGFGDVKLAAAAGAWVGASQLGAVLLLASSTALIGALMVSRTRGEALNRTMRLPFGAFLAPAIWLVWLFTAR